MYCMVSNVLCIIHADFKISIIDENIEKKSEEMKELSEKTYKRTMMQQQGNAKTPQTQHQSKRRH